MLYKENKKITSLYNGDQEILMVYHCDDLVWYKEGVGDISIIGDSSMNNGDTAIYSIRYIMPDASTYQMSARRAASALPSPDGKSITVKSTYDAVSPIIINATVVKKNGTELHATKEVTVNFLPLIDGFTIADAVVSQDNDIIFMPFVFDPEPRGDYSVTGVSLTQNPYVSVYSYNKSGIYIQRTGTIDKNTISNISLSVELTDKLDQTHTASTTIHVKYLVSDYFEIRNNKSDSDIIVTFTFSRGGSLVLFSFDIYSTIGDINSETYINEYEHVVYDRYNMPTSWTKVIPPGKSLYMFSDEMERYCDNAGATYGAIHISDDCTFAGNIMSMLKNNTLYYGSFQNLFAYNSEITTAPELPATTLADACYQYMFKECTALTTAPELPATTLADNCYYQMFYGCFSLTTAPELPATTMFEHCYEEMFRACTALTTAPELPATTLAYDCYYRMFASCTSLTAVPSILPATTLAYDCYENMFSGCISLTTTPVLPATTLVYACYKYMFSGCTSLTTAPELPATTLENSCYYGMFSGCTSLNSVTAMFTTTPGVFYSTEGWLSNVASTGTFYMNPDASWGQSIARGPDTVPVGWNLYKNIHTSEISLDKHTLSIDEGDQDTLYATVTPSESIDPVIWSSSDSSVATVDQSGVVTGVSGGYAFITAESGGYSDTCTVDVVAFIPPSIDGFYMDNQVMTDSDSSVYIPFHLIPDPPRGSYSVSNVTLEDNDYLSIDSYNNYGVYIMRDSSILNETEVELSVELEDQSGATYTSSCQIHAYPTPKFFEIRNSKSGSDMTVTFIRATSTDEWGRRIYLNLDLNIAVCDSSTTPSIYDYTNKTENFTVNVPTGKSLYMYSDTMWRYSCQGTSVNSQMGFSNIQISCDCEFAGDIRHMLRDGYIGATHYFAGLFANNTHITTSPDLSSLDLTQWCFTEMFKGCTSLTTAPALPSTSLMIGCYAEMFSGCTSLVTAPILPATNLRDQCYQGMFRNCTSLTSAPVLPATEMKYTCYAGMFQGCTSLTSAPALPATRLETFCYEYMFSGCTSLTTSPTLPATMLYGGCYFGMFKDCTNLNEVKAMFLDTPPGPDGYPDREMYATGRWLENVASTGLFFKNPSATWNQTVTRNKDSVPQDWVIVNANVN